METRALPTPARPLTAVAIRLWENGNSQYTATSTSYAYVAIRLWENGNEALPVL